MALTKPDKFARFILEEWFRYQRLDSNPRDFRESWKYFLPNADILHEKYEMFRLL